MTDNDVIQVLDFCEGYNGVSFCRSCPLFTKSNCMNTLSYELLGKGILPIWR